MLFFVPSHETENDDVHFSHTSLFLPLPIFVFYIKKFFFWYVLKIIGTLSHQRFLTMTWGPLKFNLSLSSGFILEIIIIMMAYDERKWSGEVFNPPRNPIYHDAIQWTSRIAYSYSLLIFPRNFLYAKKLDIFFCLKKNGECTGKRMSEITFDWVLSRQHISRRS